LRCAASGTHLSETGLDTIAGDDLVAGIAQALVDEVLAPLVPLPARAGPLELDEERATAGDEEEAVGPAGLLGLADPDAEDGVLGKSPSCCAGFGVFFVVGLIG
jgi:hypothetical protein